MGVERVRLQTRGRFVVRPNFASASKSLEQTSVTEMELAAVGLKTQRLFHVLRSRIKFGLRHQNSGEVHMRFGISGFEAKRDLILFFCLLPMAFFLQRQSIIKMLFGAGRHVRYHPRVPL